VNGLALVWDQRNYHVYGVFALLNGRLFTDVAVSQLQTWFNPFGQALQYFIVLYLPPRLATAALAVLASFTIPLVYLIAKNMLAPAEQDSRKGLFICIMAAIGAFVSPVFMSEIGTTNNDYIYAILYFLALIAVFRSDFSLAGFFIAGIFIGIILDIKYTGVIYVFGWIIGTISIMRLSSILPLLSSGVGALLSYIPIGGAWNIYLYIKTGNPLFPMYNNLFLSPAYLPEDMLHGKYRPESFEHALQYFLNWARGITISSNFPFRDSRFLIVLLLTILALPLIVRLLVRSKDESVSYPFERRRTLFFLCSFIGTFVMWMGFFGIHRYIVPLEQLAVLAVLCLLALLIGDSRRFLWAAGMCLALVVVSTTPPRVDGGRRSFDGNWFDIRVPAELTSGDTLHVMLTREPMGYVVPAFPASDQFVRIEGNMPLTPDTGLGKQVLDAIAHHTRIRALLPKKIPLETSLASLRRFGLEPEDGPCLDIPTKKFANELRDTHLRSCPLRTIGK